MASATAVASLVAQPKPNKVANDSQWLDLSRSRIHLSTCEAGASFRVSMFVRLFLLLLLSLLTRCAVVVVVVVVVIVLRCTGHSDVCFGFQKNRTPTSTECIQFLHENPKSGSSGHRYKRLKRAVGVPMSWDYEHRICLLMPAAIYNLLLSHTGQNMNRALDIG